MASESPIGLQNMPHGDNIVDPNQEIDYSSLLHPDEAFWKDHQPWLVDRGYVLRPRYQPGWVPSWLPGEGFPYFDYEDALWTPVSTISLVYVTHTNCYCRDQV